MSVVAPGEYESGLGGPGDDTSKTYAVRFDQDIRLVDEEEQMARVAIRARWQRLDPEMMRQLGGVAHRADRRGKVLGVDRAFEARDRDHGIGSLEGRAFGVVRGEVPAPADALEALEALDLVAGAVGIALDLDED